MGEGEDRAAAYDFFQVPRLAGFLSLLSPILRYFLKPVPAGYAHVFNDLPNFLSPADYAVIQNSKCPSTEEIGLDPRKISERWNDDLVRGNTCYFYRDAAKRPIDSSLRN